MSCPLALTGVLFAQQPATPSLPRPTPVSFHGHVVAQSGEDLGGVAILALAGGLEDPALGDLTSAEVSARATCRSAEDGSFTVTSVAGAALLLAAPGRATLIARTTQIRSWVGPECDVGLVVLPRATRRVGVVHDAGGVVLAGARVVARAGRDLHWTNGNLEHRFWSAATTDDRGRFVLDGVPRCALDVTVAASGHFTWQQRAVGESQPIAPQLSESAILDGSLVVADGGPGFSEALRLRAIYAGGGPALADEWIEPDADGRFRVTRRARSAMQLVATDPRTGIRWSSEVVAPERWDGPKRSLEVVPDVLRDDAGAARQVDVQVVRGDDGAACEAAEVWIDLSRVLPRTYVIGHRWEHEPLPALAGRTDAEGRLAFWMPARAGNVFRSSIAAAGVGLRCGPKWLDLRPDAPPRVLKMWPGVAARVKVVDAKGRGLAGALVFWSHDEAPESSDRFETLPLLHAVTDAEGWCELTQMPPGRLRLHAWHPRHPLSASKSIVGAIGEVRKWALALPPTRAIRVRVPPEVRGARALVLAEIERREITALTEQHGSWFRPAVVHTAVTGHDGWAELPLLPDLDTRLVLVRNSRHGVPQPVHDLLGTVVAGGDVELEFAAHEADARVRVRGRIVGGRVDAGRLLVAAVCDDPDNRFSGSKALSAATAGGDFEMELVPGAHLLEVVDPATGLALGEMDFEAVLGAEPTPTPVFELELLPMRVVVEVDPARATRGPSGQLWVEHGGRTGAFPIELEDGRCRFELPMRAGDYQFRWSQRLEAPHPVFGYLFPHEATLGARITVDSKPELLLRF